MKKELQGEQEREGDWDKEELLIHYKQKHKAGQDNWDTDPPKQKLKIVKRTENDFKLLGSLKKINKLNPEMWTRNYFLQTEMKESRWHWEKQLYVLEI